MASEFREFTSDEMSSMIPHFEGSTQPVSQKKKEVAETARAPLNTMQLPLNNTPVAPNPDVNAVTQSVTQANQQIQQGLPAPQAPSSVKELGKEVEQVGKSLGDTLMQNWLLPVGLAAYGAYKLLGEKTPSTVPPDNPPPPPKETKSIRDRMLLGEVKEPSFEAAPTEKPPVSPYSEAELKMLEQSEANRLAKQSEASMKQYQAAPVQPPAAPVQAAPTPVEPPAAVKPPVAEPVVTSEPVAETKTAPVEPKKNKGGRPTKAAKEAQVAGGVFKEGFGGADNWLQSQVGHDIRRFIKDEFNAGKPYGGGQAAMEKAYADVGKYEQWLKENIPVQTLNKAERKAVGVPSPEPHGPLGKAMKVGGIAGLLMTAANAANAKEAMRNIGEAMLPIGMTPGQLASGTLTDAQLRAFQEAQKLGSPYRSVPPRQ